MTYPPNDPDRRVVVREREGTSAAAIAIVALAIIAVLGIMYYAMSDNRTTATRDGVPPVTTGESPVNPAPKGPAVPAPRNTPAPAPSNTPNPPAPAR